MLHWTNRGFRPCSSNSSAQNVRAKNPRSSNLGSSSITNTPLILVSAKIIHCHVDRRPACPLCAFMVCFLTLLLPRRSGEAPDLQHHRFRNWHNKLSSPIANAAHLFHHLLLD